MKIFFHPNYCSRKKILWNPVGNISFAKIPIYWSCCFYNFSENCMLDNSHCVNYSVERILSNEIHAIRLSLHYFICQSLFIHDWLKWQFNSTFRFSTILLSRSCIVGKLLSAIKFWKYIKASNGRIGVSVSTKRDMLLLFFCISIHLSPYMPSTWTYFCCHTST